MNRVEVYSDSILALTNSIDAPAASSVDLSPDSSTLWIGTRTEQLLAISTSNLQMAARYPMAGLTPIPGVVFIFFASDPATHASACVLFFEPRNTGHGSRS